MDTSEQYSLSWNDYTQHVINEFDSLRQQNDFVDVTLCCEGGKIKAHKLMLSICSPYFKELFQENPCKHPIIVLRNILYEDLNAIVNFMYQGYVSVASDRLNSFLQTAEFLEVRGLTDSKRNSVERDIKDIEDYEMIPEITELCQLETDISPKQKPVSQPSPVRGSKRKRVQDNSQPSSPIPASPPPSSCNNDSTQKSDWSELPFPGPSVLIEKDDVIEDQTDDGGELLFRCRICWKGFKHPMSLTLHRDSHQGKTQCPVCCRNFSRSYDMRSHLSRIHKVSLNVDTKGEIETKAKIQ